MPEYIITNSKGKEKRYSFPTADAAASYLDYARQNNLKVDQVYFDTDNSEQRFPVTKIELDDKGVVHTEVDGDIDRYLTDRNTFTNIGYGLGQKPMSEAYREAYSKGTEPTFEITEGNNARIIEEHDPTRVVPREEYDPARLQRTVQSVQGLGDRMGGVLSDRGISPIDATQPMSKIAGRTSSPIVDKATEYASSEIGGERLSAEDAARMEESPEYRDVYWNIRRKYGMTPEEYATLSVDNINERIEQALDIAEDLREEAIADQSNWYVDIHGNRLNAKDDQIKATIRAIKRAQRDLNDSRTKYGEKDGWHLGKRFWDGGELIAKLTPIYNMISSLESAGVTMGQAMAAGKMIEDPERLTPEQQLLLSLTSIQQSVAQYQQDMGGKHWASGAGEVLQEMPEFMMGMPLAKLATKAVTKGATKGLAKLAGKAIAETAEEATETAAETIARRALDKATGWAKVKQVASDGIRAWGKSFGEAAIGAPTQTLFYRSLADEALGQYQVRPDGSTVQIVTPAWQRVYRAWLGTALELHSEDMGMWIGKGLNALGRRMANVGFVRGLMRVPAARSPLMEIVRKELKVADPLSEALGEVYGDAIQPLFTGDLDWSQTLADPDYWLTTVVSSAGVSVAMELPSIMQFKRDADRVNKYSMQMDYSLAVMGEDLRGQLVAAVSHNSIEAQTKALANIDWKNVSRQDMAAAMDYVNAYVGRELYYNSYREAERQTELQRQMNNLLALSYRGESGYGNTMSTIKATAKPSSGLPLNAEYYIISGDITQQGNQMLNVLRVDQGTPTREVVFADQINIGASTDITDELAKQYDLMFGEELAREGVVSISQRIAQMRAEGVNEETIREVVSEDPAYHEYKEGDVVTDNQTGEPVTINEQTSTGEYIATKSSGERIAISYDQIADSGAYAEQAIERERTSGGVKEGDVVSFLDRDGEMVEGAVQQILSDGRIYVSVQTGENNGVPTYATQEITPNQIIPAEAQPAQPTPTEQVAEEVAADAAAEVQATEQTVPAEVPIEPQPAEIASTADPRAIPTLEDGSIDYDAIEDPQQFIDLYGKNITSEELVADVTSFRDDAQQNVERLRNEVASAKTPNERKLLRDQINIESNRAVKYQAILDLLTPVTPITEQTEVAPEIAPVAEEVVEPTTEEQATEQPKAGKSKQKSDNGVKEWYENLRLSGEFDQNNSPFVLNPESSIDFGQIQSYHNLPPAPIRLVMGDVENGYIHINRRHGKEIQKAGFTSIEEFVQYVANNITRIQEGESYPNEMGGSNDTYLVQAQDGHNNTLFLQLSRDGEYWNVNSAGVFKKSYGNSKKNIWSASEVQSGNSAVAIDGSQSKPNADEGSTSNGTPSNISESKDTTTEPITQEIEQENLQPTPENAAEENMAPRKISLEQYLGELGLSQPMSDYMLDKQKVPNLKTDKARKKLEQEAVVSMQEYNQRRESARAEYFRLVENGEIVPLSDIDRLLVAARGHEDLESTQAARRSLEKRGIDWLTGDMIKTLEPIESTQGKKKAATKLTTLKTVSGAEVKVPINLYKYVSTDKTRAYTGVYFDPEGFVVATDGHNMIAVKHDVAEADAEKFISKAGDVASMIFNWRIANPKPNTEKPMDVDFVDVEKQIGGKAGDKFVVFEIDGQEVGFPPKAIHVLADFQRAFGGQAFIGDMTAGKAIVIRSGDNYAIALQTTKYADLSQAIHIPSGIEQTTEQVEQPATVSEQAPQSTNPVKQEPKSRRTADRKIEDYGEKIAGARKDILRNMSKNFDNATIESLVALPFAKAFVKPDLKKLVEAGVLRPDDAKYAEAIMWVYINKNKPKARKTDVWAAKRGRETRITAWAKKTFDGITRLRDFIEADEATRDELIAQYGQLGEQIKANEDIDRVRLNRLNGGALVFGDLYSPNPIEVVVAALDKLNYQAGDKITFDAPIVKAEYLGRYFNFENQDGEKVYAFSRANSIEEAIDTLVLQAKIRRGDTDIQYPTDMFSITREDPIREPSGMFTVFHINKRGTLIPETVVGREAAEKKVADYQSQGLSADLREEKKVVGYATHRIRFKNRLTDVETIFDEKFGSEGEARQALEERYDEFNDLANDYVASLSKQKREQPVPFEVTTSWNSETKVVKYVVKNTETGDVMSPQLDTRKEAEEYYKSHIEEWKAKWQEMKDARKKFVFFDDNVKPREGKDYRNGRDVTAEDLATTFGFRGIQFGNWTNDADRQAALNQAYDAFMDLADILGVSPKALSLAGELGIAFGARGGGSALAHYEPDEIVINLTKTKGAGSLAHEWWHALDNYFSRQGNIPMGFVTSNPTEAKMREEMRAAWQGVVKAVKGTEYAKRSMAQGDYWGRMLEMTARLFGEWTVYELAKTGRTNHFLSRGITPGRFDMWRRINYAAYKWSLPEDQTPMSFEEFALLPRSLKGMPFPTKEETEQMGEAVRNLFDVVQEKVDEQGNVVLFQRGDFPEMPNTEANRRAYKLIREKLRKKGIEVHEVSEEQARQMAEAVGAEYQIVYHGSGAAFDRFDHSFMGTGEGAQAYGWGTYVTQIKGIGETYAEAMGGKPIKSKINSLALSISNKKDFIKARKSDIRKNENYDKYAKGIRKNQISLEKELKVARSEENEKDIRFYEGLLETTQWQLDPKNHKNLIDSFWEDINDAQAEVDDMQAQIKQLKKDLAAVPKFLYSVDIIDNLTPDTYISWEGIVDDEVIDRMQEKLTEEYGEDVALTANLKYGQSGQHFYQKLERALDSDRAASEFLHRNGFVGIEYPAQYQSGGRADNAKNYVIFNENDLKIIDRVELFQDAAGKIYGWAVGGEIYLTPDGLNANTAIHEYSHLWVEALRKKDSKKWGEIKSQLQATPFWQQVIDDPNYERIRENEDAVASEVLARLTGKNGAERLAAEAQRIIDAGNGSLSARIEATALVQRVKRLLRDLWAWVARNIFGVTNEATISQLSDMVVDDLLDETPLTDAEGSPFEAMFIGELGANVLDIEQRVSYRMSNMDVAIQMEQAGKSPFDIKIATGWERGADGEWRYEISDAEAHLNIEAMAELNQRLDSGVRQRNADKLRQFEQNNPSLAKKRQEMIEKYSINSSAVEALDEVFELTPVVAEFKLRDLFDYDEAYEAYPQLMNTRVRVIDGMRSLGAHWGDNIDISLEVAQIPARMRATLLHEIQHSIQSIEGFAAGGNKEVAQELMREMEQEVLIFDFAGLVRGELRENPDLTDRQVTQKVISELKERTGLTREELESTKRIPTTKQRAEALAAARNPELYEYYWGVFQMFNAALDDEGNIDSMKAYRNLMGEVEARNTTSRRNMTAEQRRSSLGSTTEDVSRGVQIYRSRQGDDSESLSEESKYSSRVEALSAVAHDVAAKLNAPIRVVTDVNDVPQARQSWKGWWQRGESGEQIVVVVPNNIDAADIERTILHEAVAHYGLRKLLGESQFNLLLDTVLKSMTDEEVQQRMRKYGTNDPMVVADEYIAEVAEGNVTPSMFERVVSAVRAFLRDVLGLSVQMTDNDIRYLLWQSKNALEGKSAFGRAMVMAQGKPLADMVAEEYSYARAYTTEEQQIIDDAQRNGTYLKAPNGKPTNLTPKQWVQVRTKAFKRWFGDWESNPDNASKIVDANGEPLVVEHSTWNEDFYTFNIERLGESSGDEGLYGAGFYFGNVGHTQLYGDRAIRVYLDAKSPLVLPEDNIMKSFDYLVENFDKEGLRDIVVKNGNKSATLGKIIDVIKEVQAANANGEYDELIEQMKQYWSGAEDRVIEQTIFRKVGFAFYRALTPFIDENIGRREFSKSLQAAGYDGVIFDNREYVVYSPTQIKSAEINNGEFDPTDPDIRARRKDFLDAEGNTTKATPMKQAKEVKPEREFRANNLFGRFFETFWRYTGASQVVAGKTIDGLVIKAGEKELARRIKKGEELLRKREAPFVSAFIKKKIGKGDAMAAFQKLSKADKLQLSKVITGFNPVVDYMSAENRSESQGEYALKKYFDGFIAPLNESRRRMREVMGVSDQELETYVSGESSLERHNSGTDALSTDETKAWSLKKVEGVVTRFRSRLRNNMELQLKQQGANALSEAEKELLGEDLVKKLAEAGYDSLSAGEQMAACEAPVEVLWERIRALNNEHLNILLRAGRYSHDDIERIKSHDWRYYVPMFKQDLNVEGLIDPAAVYDVDVFYGTPSAPSLKPALGRDTKSQDVFRSMYQLGQRCVVFEVRNRVARSLYDFTIWANDHLGLFETRKYWHEGITYQTKTASGKWVDEDTMPSREEREQMLATQREIAALNRERLDISRQIKRLSSQIEEVHSEQAADLIDDALRGLVNRKEEILDKIVKLEADRKWRAKKSNFDFEDPTSAQAIEPNRTVRVWIDGREHRMVFADPDIARAVNGNKNGIVKAIEWFGRLVGPFTRFRAQMNTQYSPDFIVSNTLRDYQHALLAMALAEQGDITLSFAGNYFRHLGDVFRSRGINYNPLSEAELEGRIPYYSYERMRSAYIAAKVRGEQITEEEFDRAYRDWVSLNRQYLEDTYGKARVRDTFIDAFQRYGGATGFIHQLNSKQIEKQLREAMLLKEDVLARRYVDPTTPFRLIRDVISRVSESMEDITRFATFMAHLDHGASVERAAQEAKEVTTNFNRRGELATGLGSLYMFFNASVQGSAQVMRLIKQHPRRAAVVLPLYALLGFMQRITRGMLWKIGAATGIKAFFFDDDDEERPRTEEQLEKEKAIRDYMYSDNLIIVLDRTLDAADTALDGIYLRIPQPNGFRAAYKVGVELAEVAMGEQRWDELPESLISTLAGEFVYGFGDTGELTSDMWRMVIPSAVQPISDLLLNKDFVNRTIYNEREYNPIAPAYTVAKSNTPSLYIDASRILNSIGGTDTRSADYNKRYEKRAIGLDVPPEAIKYLVGEMFGGVGTFANRMWTTVELMTDGKKGNLAKRDIPFVNRVVGEFEPENVWPKYKSLTDQIEAAWSETSGFRAEQGIDMRKSEWNDPDVTYPYLIEHYKDNPYAVEMLRKRWLLGPYFKEIEDYTKSLKRLGEGASSSDRASESRDMSSEAEIHEASRTLTEKFVLELSNHVDWQAATNEEVIEQVEQITGEIKGKNQ